MKLDRVLVFLAILVGSTLGTYLCNPSFSLQQKALVLCVMVAYAGLFAYSNFLLERLDEERWRKSVLAFFDRGEEE